MNAPPIGFMQGRLSELVDGKIQAFPASSWREEFRLARELEFPLMEWTLDQEGLDENPLLSEEGRREIRSLQKACGLSIPALTGDFVKQRPFYKTEGQAAAYLIAQLRKVIEASAEVGVRYLLVPLVDNGALESRTQESRLREGLLSLGPVLRQLGMYIVFELTQPPNEAASLINSLDENAFGITYDIGDRASLGFDPLEDLNAFGTRVLNVHVKDRPRGGTTVPLGQGNSDFLTVFGWLQANGYAGNLILQAARAQDGDHAGALCRYREQTLSWWTKASALLG